MRNPSMKLRCSRSSSGRRQRLRSGSRAMRQLHPASLLPLQRLQQGQIRGQHLCQHSLQRHSRRISTNLSSSSTISHRHSMHNRWGSSTSHRRQWASPSGEGI